MCMMHGKMCPVHKTAFALVLVGALNWGLVGAFGWNLVTAIFGSMPTVERVIYVVVGLSAVAMLFACKCKKCGGCGDKSCGMDGKDCCKDGEHKM